MDYEKRIVYAPGVDKLINVYFSWTPGIEDRIFDEIYYYHEKNVYWIPDTDETFTLSVF